MPDPTDARSLSDAELIAAYNALACDENGPWCEALLAEIERRNLDL